MSITKDLNQRLKQLDYKGCYNCKYATKSKQMCDWGVNGGDGHLHFICPEWEKKENKE